VGENLTLADGPEGKAFCVLPELHLHIGGLRHLRALQRMKKAQHGDAVFPGGKAGKPLSNMAFLTLLKRMDRGDLTAHGIRSTFPRLGG
jgi:hypothetical protein